MPLNSLISDWCLVMKFPTCIGLNRKIYYAHMAYYYDIIGTLQLNTAVSVCQYLGHCDDHRWHSDGSSSRPRSSWTHLIHSRRQHPKPVRLSQFNHLQQSGHHHHDQPATC
jgi:hypothetical protein